MLKDSITQQWMFDTERIIYKLNPQTVLTVLDTEPEDETVVSMTTADTNDDKQQWCKEHV